MSAHLIAGILLDYRWPEIRFPGLGARFEQLASFPSPPRILCLGSSRLSAAIDEAELNQRILQLAGDHAPRVWNAGVEGGDLIVSDYALQQLLHRGLRPDLVVVEIAPEYLSRHNELVGLHVVRHLRWDDIPYYWIDTCRSGKPKFVFAARLHPLYLHRNEIRNIARQKLVLAANAMWWHNHPSVHQTAEPGNVAQATHVATPPIHANAIETNPATATEVAERISVKGKTMQVWLDGYQIGGTAAGALDRLLERCDEHGIAVVLAIPPVSSTFRNLYTPEILEPFFKHLKRVRSMHPFTLVSFLDSVPDRYFADSHHLRPDGAKLFSRESAPGVLVRAWGEALRTANAPDDDHAMRR